MNLLELRAWFFQAWPRLGGKRAVLSGYLALKAQPHVVADICMRNYVLRDAPAGNEIELAIAEGRRRCAMEIMRLAGLELEDLWKVIEASAPSKPNERKP